MRVFRVELLWLMLTVVSSSCAHRAATRATEDLEWAGSHVGTNSSAHVKALAGFHALLMTGDAKSAQAFFDESLKHDASQPLALMGQVLMAQRLAQPQRALEAALELVAQQPQHPLTAVAARVVLDTASMSSSTSALIRERVPVLLEKRLLADTAHLLRASLANAYFDGNDGARHQSMLADMGVPTSGTLVGPFSPWHLLSTAESTPVEKDGSLEKIAPGPFGPLSPRELRFADGRLSLAGEPSSGDVYLYAVDVNVSTGGRFVLRTVSAMDHVAVVDGTTVMSRLTSVRPASTLTTQVISLRPGIHRLMLRMARENQAGNLNVALQRFDGRPAGLTFSPARGPALSWGSQVSIEHETRGLYSSAESLRLALEDEGGDALARVVAARDALSRDGDGARALVAGISDSLRGAVVAMLRADVFLQDKNIPARVARGRATRELEAALAADASLVSALMLSAQLALDDGRQLQALEVARSARDAVAPPGGPVLHLMARIELALGLDASAAATARLAEAALPGSCDALLLLYDLAHRRDAIAESDALLRQSSHCSGALSRTAEHRRARGEVEAAISAWEAVLARDEGQVSVAISLASLYVAQKRVDDAVRLLVRLSTQWPRNVQLLGAIAEIYQVSGRNSEALLARQAALALDGSDLSLRRAVERQLNGKELLNDYAISTEEALKDYQAPGGADATSAFVLDAAAIQAFPDGSMVDRVHIIQKALDQQGVQEIAEVDIPPGAAVLKLRTLKPDGRTLEPEQIEGKDVTSLPGVQVGDMVEYEYLLAHPSRGPGMPGFTATPFYFQMAQQPNARSNYGVIAPKGSGLEVDAHHVRSLKPEVQGEFEIFKHEERQVPPYIPEPNGPPSANEWLPFVSVGAGQRGNERLVMAYADSFLERGLIAWEVEAFAREAVKGLVKPQPVDVVRAVYAAVQHKLSGRDAGLGVSAATSVAQERGSRVWLMKGALEALGIEARLVAVRAFTTDPATYVFPNESLLPYLCLRVSLPQGQKVWLDPLVRFGPFGEIPEFGVGGLEAYVLPEPGRPMEKTTTPASTQKPGKRVVLKLTLNEAGELAGAGEETYTGFEAAQLAEALESISEEQRNQSLESALSRYFGGADLSKLSIEMTREVGAPVKVSYEFTARRFARADGPERLVASSLTYPLMVGRRFLAVSQRVTPLFIEASEVSTVSATVQLPAGWVLRGPVADIKLKGPSGEYARQERQSGSTVLIEESFHLTHSRIAPEKYEAFSQFAGDVDLAQQRDLFFEKVK
jgi:tetratricopeptide (TPR) repeat protein